VSGDRSGRIMVWDLNSAARLFTITGHTASLSALQFDRGLLITDGREESLSLHDFGYYTH
jgi:WD40 repeat protein